MIQKPLMMKALTYRKSLLGFFSRRVSDKSDIEDMVQEVFLRLCQRDGREGVLKVEQYLFQVASSVLTDRIRRRTVRQQDRMEPLADDDQQLLTELSPERIAIGREQLQQLWSALAELPSLTRDIFVLHTFEGYKYAELAQRLRVSERTVQKHMTRALARLLDELGAAG